MNKIIIHFFSFINRLQQRYAYRQYMKKKRRELFDKLDKLPYRRHLTEEQKREIVDFYNHHSLRLSFDTSSTNCSTYFVLK